MRKGASLDPDAEQRLSILLLRIYISSKSFSRSDMNEQDDLDPYSRGLLEALMRDSRQTVQQLADAVGLSPSPCWKRIKAMEASGESRGYTAIGEPEKISLGQRVEV